ncbi:MAG: FecR domain-containing protein [Balneola sp.]
MTSDASNNDQDFKLSKKIEKANTASDSIKKEDDPIAQDLLSYKKLKKESFDSQPSNKDQVWKRIEASTKPAQKSNILTFVSSSTKKWAVAATVVIAAVLSLFYFQTLQIPTLIAQSGSSIETVTLEDGSVINLRPNSTLYSVAESSTSMIYKIDGEAFFDVTSNSDRTFSVQATNGTVSVLGTRFNLSSWGEKLQVFLEEGSVEVQSTSNNQSLILEPGESALIGKDNLPVKQDLNIDETKDWLNNELVFNNRETGDVLTELEQEFNVIISIAANLESERLTGRLSLENIENALSDLGMVLDGTFVNNGENQYSFESN